MATFAGSGEEIDYATLVTGEGASKGRTVHIAEYILDINGYK
jgi:hypothetical protein